MPLTKEEYEEMAKFDAELDTSWCDVYEGNAHLVTEKELRMKCGKKYRPTKAQQKEENKLWEEMEKERLETMPRPSPAQQKKVHSNILDSLQLLKDDMPPAQYLELKTRVEQAANEDPDSWIAQPSTSSGNPASQSIEDIITALTPYVAEHIQNLLNKYAAIHQKEN